MGDPLLKTFFISPQAKHWCFPSESSSLEKQSLASYICSIVSVPLDLGLDVFDGDDFARFTTCYYVYIFWFQHIDNNNLLDKSININVHCR